MKLKIAGIEYNVRGSEEPLHLWDVTWTEVGIQCSVEVKARSEHEAWETFKRQVGKDRKPKGATIVDRGIPADCV